MSLGFLEKCAYLTGWKCNLSCHGCSNYSNHMIMSREELPNWKEDFSFFKNQFRAGKFYIVGGEPLLNNELKEIINEAFTFSDNVQLVTNGLLLKHNLWLFDILVNNPNFDIYISYHQSREFLGKSKYDEMLFESICEFLKQNNYKSSYTVESLINKVERVKDIKMIHGLPIIQRMNLGLTFQDWIYPKLDENDIPVPYNSDYVKAKTDACHCPVPHLYKKKIYKCHVSALLPDLLKKYNVYDDKWNKLKEYRPYDLENPTGTYSNLTQPEPVCSICPESPSEFLFGKKDKYSKIINIMVK
jgi:MoaA/NifB/PqqE/SkfB family radical SAM enzyme